MDFYTWLGVVGLLILLAGFTVEHFGAVKRKSFYFNFSNLIGSLLLGVYAYALFALYFLVKK
jgi:hypothetical protein